MHRREHSGSRTVAARFAGLPLIAALLVVSLGVATPWGAGEARPVMSEESVPAEGGVRLTTIVSGLERPWGMAWLSDDTILVTERPGRLRVVSNGTLDPRPVSGVPKVFASGQGGLMDVALHPDFATNRLIYLTYAHGDDDANRTRVARAVFDGQALDDLEVIFENADAKEGGQHFGSRLLWLPDGTLLVSIGDGGNPPTSFAGDEIRKQAQNLGTHFGKLIRIRDDGQVPNDNPFVGQPGAKPEIYSYGHRNIQGLARDPETGAIFANEHGARRGDELNRVEAGANHGWPAATFSRNYVWGTEISPHTSLPGMVDPVFVWSETHAPSGLAVYRGDVFPRWDGDVFSGGLKTEDVRRIEFGDGGAVMGETAIDFDARVRDIRVGPDGHVYVLTDERDGQLIRIDPEQ